jgi:hypothetical protein
MQVVFLIGCDCRYDKNIISLFKNRIPVVLHIPSLFWLSYPVSKCMIKKKQVFAGSHFHVQTDESWWHSEQEQEIFLYSSNFHTSLGAHQDSVQWVPGAISTGAKIPANVATHSLQCSAKVKNAYSCTFPPPFATMACTWSILQYKKQQLPRWWTLSALWLYSEALQLIQIRYPTLWDMFYPPSSYQFPMVGTF